MGARPVALRGARGGVGAAHEYDVVLDFGFLLLPLRSAGFLLTNRTCHWSVVRCRAVASAPVAALLAGAA